MTGAIKHCLARFVIGLALACGFAALPAVATAVPIGIALATQ